MIGILLVGVVLVWQAAFSAPDGNLHLTLMDTGAGETILIETPEGRFILIGGGDSPSRLSDGLGRSLSLFNRQLDALIVASTRRSQVGALPAVLPRFEPAKVWWAGDVDASMPAGQVYAWLSKDQIPVAPIEPGQVLSLGERAQFQALAVSEEGAVLILSMDRFRCVLPIGEVGELLEMPDVQVYSREMSAVLLARSGELESNPIEWLAASDPEVILLSVDGGNRSGLPDASLLEMLSAYPVLRTDINGSIELVTDGKQFWIYSEK